MPQTKIQITVVVPHSMTEVILLFSIEMFTQMVPQTLWANRNS